MAQWLRRPSQDIKYVIHEIDVMGSDNYLVQLRVHSPFLYNLGFIVLFSKSDLSQDHCSTAVTQETVIHLMNNILL